MKSSILKHMSVAVMAALALVWSCSAWAIEVSTWADLEDVLMGTTYTTATLTKNITQTPDRRILITERGSDNDNKIINLNGHTLTGNKDTWMFTVKGASLTIRGGNAAGYIAGPSGGHINADGNTGCCILCTAGTVRIQDGVTFKDWTFKENIGACIYMKEDGVLRMTGGTFENCSGSGVHGGAVLLRGNKSAMISGGTISGCSDRAVWVSSMSGSTPQLNVTGGTFESDPSLTANGDGVIYVKGGKYTDTSYDKYLANGYAAFKQGSYYCVTNCYNVTLNKNGGSCSDLTIYVCGTVTQLPKDAVKTGYTFGGWYANSACTGTAVTQIGATETGDKTFWAKWTANTYTIAFNGNGSTGGSTASLAMTYDTAKNLTANGFTKTGYTFAGWATSASGAVVYSDKQSVKNLTATKGATVTLYAKWTANTYTIAFNGNGSTGGSTASLAMTYDTAKNLTANGFTKTGYTFAGWATSASGAVVYTDKQSVKNLTATKGATVMLYAKWTANVYTVTLNKDGGTCTDLTKYTYGVGATLPTDVTKTDLTFGGWFTNATFAGVAWTAIGTTELGAKTFWAKWLVSSAEPVKDDKNQDVTVSVSEAWMASNNVEKANLDTDGSNGIKIWKSYVLGLDPNDANSTTVVTPVQTTDTENLTINLGSNFKPQTDAGVDVMYRLDTSDGSEWTEGADEQDSPTFSTALPLSGVKYYKIVTRFYKK